ncbi:DNA mismatch repair protein MutS [Rhizobium lentis]|uniref:Smr/MutS family protein n=1 Tax=Rhizobium lentis TaxID=1138194 RepID=UPI001C830326|nr:Smr/MutS family protein [Rhizobium lentis]MBX5085895.1 DNA mismatch repair protein MutS [Rhizobium lentis]MBX5098885.1 DNA mismatch repair protein MutS [Rhizobium lentis]MBX5123174.1 DNA mismatch repair protein MutS [Rhizobium lentis]
MARDRKLSADERILWGKVARSTRPMPGKADELTELDAFLAETEAAAERQKAETPTSPSPTAALPAPPATPRHQAKVHHPLEKPVKRKIAKGRLALEARIDLHGLVQSEAHGILLDFLIRAHERGMRHVLVITGKGSSLGSEGALKRAVPLWFSKPEFRYLISSYEPAAQHHGGEGALYIRLSRRHGEKA